MTHSLDRFLCIIMLLLMIFVPPGFAEDSESSRATLAGIQGVCVVVEELQPNLQKYASKSGLTRMQLQKDIEQALRSGGIRMVSGNDWLKVPGRPVFYVNVNTHETEKYWYAYDIKLELRQVVTLDANQKVKALAVTWSINMTGIANIGNLNIIKHDAMVLVEKFVGAYKAVNKGKQ
jgi:hypothetical protein